MQYVFVDENEKEKNAGIRYEQVVELGIHMYRVYQNSSAEIRIRNVRREENKKFLHYRF